MDINERHSAEKVVFTFYVRVLCLIFMAVLSYILMFKKEQVSREHLKPETLQIT